MENKIDIAAILKDCPQGMELDCTMYDNLYFDSLNADYYGTINCYTLIDGIKTSINFTKYGTFNNHIGAKCVIFPKGKTTWEGFHRLFKDGDIIVTTLNNIAIIKKPIIEGELFCVYGLMVGSDFYNDEAIRVSVKRLATEEEKQKLFGALKENGYCWNAETKTLEKLIDSKRPFVDGDVIYNKCIKAVAIFNKQVDNATISHCYLNIHKELRICHYHCKNLFGWRLATEEEKQNLFDAIKANGYKWNPKTKTLEKLIVPKFKVGDRIKNSDNCRSSIVVEIKEDCFIIKTLDGLHHSFLTDKIPFSKQVEYELVTDKFNINTLKPFDEVLVRLTNNCVWMPKFFSYYDLKTKCYPFVTTDNMGYPQCIPYSGNEHLCRKTNNCDEFYRNWE